MPENWKTYKLGDIAKIKYGKDHKKLNEGNVPCYGTGGIMRYVDSFLSDEESVLIPRKGSLNSIFYINEPFWTVDTLFWTKVNLEYAFPKYLYYYLKTIDFVSKDVGSAIPSLTTSLLNVLELSLPETEEQHAIAAILSALDDKIENNLAMNKTLEAMAMALYKHWFVDFGPFQDGRFIDSELGLIPEGWEVKSVYDVANYVNGAAFKPKDFGDDGLFIIKIAELKNGISSNTKRTKRVVRNEIIFDNGSVLFSWSASLDVFLWDKGPALLNQHIFNVLPNGTLTIEILYFMLKNIIAYFQSIAAGRATTMGHITQSHLKETLLAIPSHEELQSISSHFRKFYDILLTNMLEVQTLTQLRDTLLPKLISGEVRVKDIEKTIREVL